jgi:hypothetical protein
VSATLHWMMEKKYAIGALATRLGLTNETTHAPIIVDASCSVLSSGMTLQGEMTIAHDIVIYGRMHNCTVRTSRQGVKIFIGEGGHVSSSSFFFHTLIVAGCASNIQADVVDFVFLGSTGSIEGGESKNIILYERARIDTLEGGSIAATLTPKAVRVRQLEGLRSHNDCKRQLGKAA